MEFKIDDDLHQKEQEYRQALNDKLKHLSNALKCRDHEISQLNENFEALQKDFLYNISLLRDRDKELEDNDHIIHNMKQELHHRAGEVSDLKIQLAEQTASFQELHKQHTQLKQHLEKNTVDREKYMDLKRQYERSLQSWQEQMELLQSVHKRQILKLESDFHQHSTETQKQYSTTISEGKLAHSAQVQELQKALDEKTNQVKHLKQQLQESMHSNSILQKNVLGLQQRINENKSVFESELKELHIVKENLTKEQARQKECEERAARYRDIISNINTITANFAKAQKVHVGDEDSNPEGTMQLVQKVLDKVGDELIKHATLQGGEDITDQSQEIKILQQQNEILREVTKELKKKVARCETSTASMKIWTGKEDSDDDRKKAGYTKRDLIRAGAQSSTHRDDNKENYHSHEYTSQILVQRDAIEELLMNLNTKVEKLTKEMEEKNNAENSEESLRIRELHEKIRYLKMTMLEDLRRKFQQEGNQEGMTYDDVRIMLLEQKLELVSQRIGNAVSSENKSLLKAVENVKEDLMKQLQAERKQLESSRSVEKHTDLVRERQFNLKSEELLQNIRNEIARLELRIEEKLSYKIRPLEITGHTCCNVATSFPPPTLHSHTNLHDIHNVQPIEFQEQNIETVNSNDAVQEKDPKDNVSSASSSSSIQKVWDLLREVNPLENRALPEKPPRPTVQPVIIHEPKTRATIPTIGKPLTFKADTRQQMVEKKKPKVRNYNIRD